MVAERLGVRRGAGKRTEEPLWKRIKQRIRQLRQDISQNLKRKYNIDKKRCRVVLEELKQLSVSAQATKLRRYEDRNTQYRQNRLFETNQRRFFEEIEGVERDNDIISDKEESKEYWNGIWGKRVEHNWKAERLQELEKELNGVEQQSDIKVTVELMMKQLRKISNRKSPGLDGLQGYWIKNFSALKDRIMRQLNWCLQDNSVPDWMTRGI